MAAAQEDGTISIFDLETKELSYKMTGHLESVRRVLFHPKLDLLVSWSWDNTTRIWNLNTRAGNVAFSNGGKYMAVVQVDHVSLRDADSFQEITQISQADEPTLTSVWNNPIGIVEFSPNSQFLAIGAMNDTTQLWDLKALRKKLESMGLDW